MAVRGVSSQNYDAWDYYTIYVSTREVPVFVQSLPCWRENANARNRRTTRRHADRRRVAHGYRHRLSDRERSTNDVAMDRGIFANMATSVHWRVIWKCTRQRKTKNNNNNSNTSIGRATIGSWRTVAEAAVRSAEWRETALNVPRVSASITVRVHETTTIIIIIISCHCAAHLNVYSDLLRFARFDDRRLISYYVGGSYSEWNIVFVGVCNTHALSIVRPRRRRAAAGRSISKN